MTRQPGRFLLGVFLFCVTISGARAEDTALALALGNATRVVVARAFETVMIGDPLVVDVRIDDDRSLVINPLNPGVTNLILVDASGIVTANIRVLVCAARSHACDGRAPPGNADVEKPESIRRDVRGRTS
ncbi:MAG TPA: pilus assembly protein N-terminal domain-containing protein [Bradyrhizobium sp.]|uniref:pilus assembly protein N-terminal domain-containing protein n=1 Tax=Bradyrhizobium sp. TaxID=376 RepID=UPI002C962656|nr:pilus assembly protein N-terminal domain-containing protein [Bradyrhizobium sp.]HLZ00661.1 pilus assembly protein N-terminal domain-containing protein [Bradyrhizobium sp.]